MPRRRPAEVRTRRAILDLLKREGPQDSAALAEKLGVSPMAVRQHLYALQQEKLLAWQDDPRPRGRPAKLWRLTPAADRFFPDAHAELATRLIDAVRSTFGPEGLERVISVRQGQQASQYGEALSPDGSMARRLGHLARLRAAEGYMAEVKEDKDGSWLFIENHCPICVAARGCQGFCDSELALFQRLLGPGVNVERTEHIVAGGRRCAYRVSETG